MNCNYCVTFCENRVLRPTGIILWMYLCFKEMWTADQILKFVTAASNQSSIKLLALPLKLALGLSCFSNKMGLKHTIRSVQFSSVQSLSRVQLFATPWIAAHQASLSITITQTHVHRVSDAIQPPHPLSSPSPPAHNPSQHQSLFQWVNSSFEVAKVLEF